MKCLADARLLCLAAAAAAAAQAAQAAVFRPSQAAALRPLELAGLSLEELVGKVRVEPRSDHFSEEFFEEMRQRIEGQLSNISASQALAQQSLDRLHDNFTACANGSDGIEEIEALVAQKGNLSASHKACRVEESNQTAALAAAEEVLQAKVDLEDAACDELDHLKDSRDPDMCHFQGDEAQGDGGYGDWLQRLKAEIDEMLDNYTRLNESCSNATAAASEQEAICNPLDAELNATRARCDRMQSELENTTCSLVTAANRTCSAHGSCLTDAWDALHEQLPSFEEAEANRTAEWKALSQMLCLVDAILEGEHDQIEHDQIDACGQESHDTDHLNLNHSKAPGHPDPLGHRACTPLSPDPCSTEYLDDEYGGLPDNVETQACSVCPRVPVAIHDTSSGSFLMAPVPTGAAHPHRPDQALEELLGQLHGLLRRTALPRSP